MGECSCVSVHGANRLGTNSLLDLLVFGRAAGNHIVEFNDKLKEHKPLPANAADRTLERAYRGCRPGTTASGGVNLVDNAIRAQPARRAGARCDAGAGCGTAAGGPR